MARADLYISLDIEADGPVPGPYSMLSFGLAVAARFDGTTFTAHDPDQQTFYRELRPISDRFDEQALRVARLNREHLTQHGAPPEQAMAEAAEWVAAVAGEDRPVAVAFPLAFDWPFLHWYFVQFCDGRSPFSFSSCLDIKTAFWQRAGTVLDDAGKDDLPDDLRPRRPHTHNALDDAVEQAELFVRLWSWRP